MNAGAALGQVPGFTNPFIAKYYCLPHLLIPLPFLFAGPVLVAMGVGKYGAMAGAAIVMGAVGHFLLRRLPDLFADDQREKYAKDRFRSAAGLFLAIPAIMAVMAAIAGTASTTAIAFEDLAATPPGTYHYVTFPTKPDFSNAAIVRDEISGAARGGTKQTLLIASDYGWLAGRHVVLVERPRSGFSALYRGDALKEELDRSRDSMSRFVDNRFRAVSSSGPLVVRSVTWQQLGVAGRPVDDLVLEWNVDTPEKTRAIFSLFTVAFYFFPYVLAFVLVPLLATRDHPLAVAEFRQASRLRTRLFGFVRKR